MESKTGKRKALRCLTPACLQPRRSHHSTHARYVSQTRGLGASVRSGSEFPPASRPTSARRAPAPFGVSTVRPTA